MRKFIAALSIGFLAILAAGISSAAEQGAKSGARAPNPRFEVLSPWADADPIPLRGISPRLADLEGKKIGLFVTPKRAAMPIAESIRRRLGAMYPGVQTVIFHSTTPNVNEIETKNKEKFTAWANGVDAAILVVGD